MSYASPYVKCADGRWYRDLVYEGPDRFVCFDDTDPPELVVKKSSTRTPEEILQERGIPFVKLRKRSGGGRMFGADDQREFIFTPARAYFIDTPRPPFSWPTPNEGDRWDAVVDDLPSHAIVRIAGEK